MDKELRILILEDVPADAELEEYELRKAGLVFISKVVDTEETFLKALDEFSPDIILSDYDLPTFDGLAALRIVKKKCPDVPFILVTGKLGEEFVIEKLKEGSTDYVLKNNLQRLVPSVKRALEEVKVIAERKEAEEALRRGEKRFHTVIDQAADAFFIHNTQGQIVDVNKRACQSLGYTREELLSKTITDIDPEAIEKGKDTLWGKVINGETAIFESYHKRKNGDSFPVEISLGAIHVDHETLILAIVRDITERKQAEEKLQESEEKFRIIFDNASDGILLADPETKRFYFGNKTICKTLGYSEEELKNLGLQEIHPEKALPYVVEQFEKQTRHEIELAKNIPVKRKDGSVFYADINSFPVTIDGKQYITGIFRDITERKWTEQVLRHERDRAQAYFNIAEVIMIVLDTDRKVFRINKKGCKVLGYAREDIIGKDWFDNFIPERKRDKLKEVFLRIITGDTYPAEYVENPILTKNREEKIIAWHNTLLKDEKGNVIGTLSSGEDITERKKAEEALHENREQLDSIFRASPVGIGIVSFPDRIILKVNDRFCTILGYSNKELVGKSARVVYPTDEYFEYVGKRKYELIKEHDIGTVETRMKCKDGRIIDVLLSSSPIDRNNLSLGVTFTVLDITERKQAEEKIQKLASVVKYSSELVNLATLDGKMIFLNEAGGKILGIDPREIEQVNIIQVIPDHLLNLVQNELLPELMEGRQWEGDLQYRNLKTGLLTDVHAITFTINDPGTGKPLYFANVSLDITERKKIEVALKESEERFKDLFESANDLIQIVDVEGKFVYVNRKWRELLSYTDTEARQKQFTTIVRKDQIPHCTEVFKKVVNGESIERMETVFVSKDGREIYVEGSLNPSFKEGGFVSCRGIFRDITERKKAEELEHQRTDQIILNKAALLELTTMHPEELEAFYKIITIICSQVLGVERVSIWMFDNLHNEIICEALYILSKHIHEKGLRLQVQQYPQYFQAIEENSIVAEDDVFTDPRTNEFTEQYLKPLGILSMMDIPIRRRGKVIGILCFRHTEPRQWTYEDQNFAAAIAQIIRSSLEDFDRKKAEDALRDNKEDLQKRVKDLEDFYAMAVGRELRMKELKEQIKELEEELAKYKKQ